MPSGRKKQFDTVLTLEKAMLHFTQHGFNGTNIHDLLQSMGIGRQSLYDTFGDKRQLFLQCVDQYENQFAVKTAPPFSGSSQRALLGSAPNS